MADPDGVADPDGEEQPTRTTIKESKKANRIRCFMRLSINNKKTPSSRGQSVLFEEPWPEILVLEASLNAISALVVNLESVANQIA